METLGTNGQRIDKDFHFIIICRDKQDATEWAHVIQNIPKYLYPFLRIPEKKNKKQKKIRLAAIPLNESTKNEQIKSAWNSLQSETNPDFLAQSV